MIWYDETNHYDQQLTLRMRRSDDGDNDSNTSSNGRCALGGNVSLFYLSIDCSVRVRENEQQQLPHRDNHYRLTRLQQRESVSVCVSVCVCCIDLAEQDLLSLSLSLSSFPSRFCSLSAVTRRGCSLFLTLSREKLIIYFFLSLSLSLQRAPAAVKVTQDVMTPIA